MNEEIDELELAWNELKHERELAPYRRDVEEWYRPYLKALEELDKEKKGFLNG